MATVLIVDDEHHIRLLIEQTLEELEDEGVELQTAASGEEALGVIEQQHPALVFLDVTMPGMSGYDVCRTVKRDWGATDTKIVLLTARGKVEDRELGRDVGADLFLTKPFDPDELLAHARTLLGLGAATGAAASATEGTGA